MTEKRGPEIKVVIPTLGTRAELRDTLDSLRMQTLPPTSICIEFDWRVEGAPVMRNRGAEGAEDGTLIVFSDDDCRWEPDAFENMYEALEQNPEASFSFGWYRLGPIVVGRKEQQVAWNEPLLRRYNFVSSMVMFRAEEFPGWDESVTRLQDYDLWLKMISLGKRGASCRRCIFTTTNTDGISSKPLPPNAFQDLRIKHDIDVMAATDVVVPVSEQ